MSSCRLCTAALLEFLLASTRTWIISACRSFCSMWRGWMQESFEIGGVLRFARFKSYDDRPAVFIAEGHNLLGPLLRGNSNHRRPLLCPEFRHVHSPLSFLNLMSSIFAKTGRHRKADTHERSHNEVSTLPGNVLTSDFEPSSRPCMAACWPLPAPRGPAQPSPGVISHPPLESHTCFAARIRAIAAIRMLGRV